MDDAVLEGEAQFSVTNLLSFSIAEWRVALKTKTKMDKLRKRELVDYVDRRDNHNCDATDIVPYEEDTDEEAVEEELPAGCEQIASPFSKLSKDITKWLKTWNTCGDGPPRANYHARMRVRLQKIQTLGMQFFGKECRNKDSFKNLVYSYIW